MPCARSAACPSFIAPPGNSANTTASLVLSGSLPMASPPSLSRSFGSRPLVLPAPITTSRETFSPSGTTSSSAEPLLPVKRSALAARITRPAAAPSALAVAGPNLSPSSQNTTRTPVTPILAGAAKGANPSFRASDIGAFLDSGTSEDEPIWLARYPSAKPQIGRIQAFHHRVSVRPPPRRRVGPDSAARPAVDGPAVLLFVVHVQRLCLTGHFVDGSR